MQEDVKPAVDRRRLLRRAGAVAAGIGAAGVATTAVGTPAHAADDAALVQGALNTGADKSTTIRNVSATKPALVLDNTGGAAALQISTTPVASTASPTGSVFIDKWGDIFTVGDQHVNSSGGTSTGEKYITPVYSATWATMTIPVNPFRWLVTLPGWTNPQNEGKSGRYYVKASSAKYDSAGRVLPQNSNTKPDLILDFSDWLPGGGYAAVQGNLTIASATAGGFAALYAGNNYPGNSSINFNANQPIANFTQTLLHTDGTISIKLNKPAVVIFDVLGFVLTDPYQQGLFASGGAGATATAAAQAPRAGRRLPQR